VAGLGGANGKDALLALAACRTALDRFAAGVYRTDGAGTTVR
jgi:hypothetical protein